MTLTHEVQAVPRASQTRSVARHSPSNQTQLSRTRLAARALFLATMLLWAGEMAFADSENIWRDEGSGNYWYVESYEDGSRYIWLLDKDMNPVEGWEIGNPNPEDGSGSGAPTPEAIKDYIEQHYKTKLSKGQRLNNPLNLKRSAQGKGLDPIWIPSETARDAEGGGVGSGPGTNSGDVSGWIKQNARKGGSGDDSDSGSDSGPAGDRPELGTTGSTKPEVINPPHVISKPAGQQSPDR